MNMYLQYFLEESRLTNICFVTREVRGWFTGTLFTFLLSRIIATRIFHAYSMMIVMMRHNNVCDNKLLMMMIVIKLFIFRVSQIISK